MPEPIEYSGARVFPPPLGRLDAKLGGAAAAAVTLVPLPADVVSNYFLLPLPYFANSSRTTALIVSSKLSSLETMKSRSAALMAVW